MTVLEAERKEIPTFDYGPTYRYFITVSFTALTGPIQLRARVTQKLYDSVRPGRRLAVRYANGNPRIALIRGESSVTLT